jgi:hypothetical protein
MEGIVVFTELMMDQRVGGEAVLGEPGTVEPIAVECPLEEAALNDTDQKNRPTRR